MFSFKRAEIVIQVQEFLYPSYFSWSVWKGAPACKVLGLFWPRLWSVVTQWGRVACGAFFSCPSDLRAEEGQVIRRVRVLEPTGGSVHAARHTEQGLRDCVAGRPCQRKRSALGLHTQGGESVTRGNWDSRWEPSISHPNVVTRSPELLTSGWFISLRSKKVSWAVCCLPRAL